MRRSSAIFSCIAVALLAVDCDAGVISMDFFGEIMVNAAGIPITDDSTAVGANLSLTDDDLVLGSLLRQVTSDLDWSYDVPAETITAAGSSTTAGLLLPFGATEASSQFRATFEIDSAMAYAMDGTFAVSASTTGGDDNLTYSLSEQSTGLVMSDSLSANDTFSEAGVLAPGVYDLVVNSDLQEDYGLVGFDSSAWSMDSFSLTAVPEPGSVLTLCCAAMCCLGFRRKRQVTIDEPVN